MSPNRRRFCAAGALVLSTPTIVGSASAQSQIEVAGTIRSEVEADVGGVEFRLQNISNDRVRSKTTVAASGKIDLTLPETGEYRVTIFDLSVDNNRIPVVYSFNNVFINDDSDIGEFVIPETYQTEIRFVSEDDNPIKDLPVNFRAENGTGLPPGAFTTDADGYVKYPGASERGVELSSPTTIEIQPSSTPAEETQKIQTVFVTEPTEFEYTIANPEQYNDGISDDSTDSDADSGGGMSTMITFGTGVIMAAGGYVVGQRRSNRQEKSKSRNESSGETPQTNAKSASENAETVTSDNQSSIKALQDDAETALNAGDTEKKEGNFEAATEHYSQALDLYQTAKSKQDADADYDFTPAIEATKEELQRAETLQEHRTTISEALRPAERSLQEAIVAYMQDNQTLARIRFRQARDSFEDAHKTIVDIEVDLLSNPIEVTVEPDRALSSTRLGDIPMISEAEATALADAKIEAVDNLDSSNGSPWTPAAVEELVDDETIDEDAATALTLLSWWHGNERYGFTTAEAVEKRQQQADYGFNQSS